eukprot:NODE_248_length_11794_cov_0.876015.p3 type:complete len:519 gc:universal NODE_248_length_11794_cov_0.876015:187-1743(+)
MLGSQIHSYLSLVRLSTSEKSDDICLDLMNAVEQTESSSEEIRLLPEIVRSKFASPLECAFMLMNEANTINKTAFLCYGKIDEMLNKPLAYYQMSQTLLSNNEMKTFSGRFIDGYFVVIDGLGYIPHLLLKFELLKGVSFVQFCVTPINILELNLSMDQWKDMNFRVSEAPDFVLTNHKSEPLLSFKNKYPNNYKKYELRDGLVELHEERLDCLSKCVVEYSSENCINSMVREYYRNRPDFLLIREIVPATNCVKEHFQFGRKDGLKSLSLRDIPLYYEFYDVRMECLVSRSIGESIVDRFSLRPDSLYSRTYFQNIYLNIYEKGFKVISLEFNALNDHIKLVFPKMKNLMNPFVILEKNSLSSETKEPFSIVKCCSVDLAHSRELENRIEDFFEFAAYEITKILNERTEIQTKLDSILKDRNSQEKVANDIEPVSQKNNLSIKNLVQIFKEQTNSIDSMKDFFESQYNIRVGILTKKLSEAREKGADHKVESEVILSRLSKIKEEKIEKIKNFTALL